MKYLLTTLYTLMIGVVAMAQQPNPPGQVKPGDKPVNEAYLFAHMTHQDMVSCITVSAWMACIGTG